MRIYKTKHALFVESYKPGVGLRQSVVIRNSLLEQTNFPLSFDIKIEKFLLALNLYVTEYEKNPNAQKRFETLANEIKSFTMGEFQKASEVIGATDVLWETPVFVVTWSKKETDINQIIGNPICSKCKGELKSIGSLSDMYSFGVRFTTNGSLLAGRDNLSGGGDFLYSGTICPNCDFIFCSDCLDSTGKGHCPECNILVTPALAKDLPIKQKFLGDTSNIKTHSPNPGNDDKVVFVREIKKQIEFAPAGKMNTYMVYRADSAQIAQDFLAKYPVNDNNLIVVVETPEGTFDKNKHGIYKEQ